MRTRLRTWLFSVTALCLVAAASPARAEFVVGPSINVARWFTWPRYDKAPATTIAWPPYNPTPKPPSAADLRALKQAGFDTVRLPVDPAPFFVFEGEKRQAVYKILFDALDRIRDAGLKVIVDLHPNSRHPAWGQHAVIAGLDAPAFTAFNGVVGEMARRLARRDRNRVALELMNEPRLKCKGDQQALWQRMLGRMVATARKAAPHLTLVATGACVSSIEGLIALDPAALHDKNLIYTFHFYEPFAFTHQGASFIPWPEKYLDEVPWPAGKRPMEQVAARIDRNVERANLDLLAREKARIGARANLAKYYASNAGRGLLDKRFDQVADWARRHDIAPNRILIGEFGVLRKNGDAPGALCADRMQWLADTRGSAARHGFAWSYFSYDGPFAIVASDQNHTLDPDVLSALGLRGQPVACGGSRTH